MTALTPTVTNTSRYRNADRRLAAPGSPRLSERRRCAAARSLPAVSANAIASAMRTASSPAFDRRTYARCAFAYAQAPFGSAGDCGTVAVSARFDAWRTFPIIHLADDIAPSCKRSSLSALRDGPTDRQSDSRMERTRLDERGRGEIGSDAAGRREIQLPDPKKALFPRKTTIRKATATHGHFLAIGCFYAIHKQCVTSRRNSHAKHDPEPNHARSLAANANDK